AWRASWDAALRRVPMLFPLIVYSAAASWTELLGIALRVRGRRRLEAATIVSFRAFGLVLVAAALLSGTGLRGLVWAFALSALFALALAVVFLRASAAAEDQEPGIEPGVGRTLKASAPLAVNGVQAILSLRIELLAREVFRASREAG